MDVHVISATPPLFGLAAASAISLSSGAARPRAANLATPKVNHCFAHR